MKIFTCFLVGFDSFGKNLIFLVLSFEMFWQFVLDLKHMKWYHKMRYQYHNLLVKKGTKLSLKIFTKSNIALLNVQRRGPDLPGSFCNLRDEHKHRGDRRHVCRHKDSRTLTRDQLRDRPQPRPQLLSSYGHR